MENKLDVVLGSQGGDEGQGKLVDTIGNRYGCYFPGSLIDTIFVVVLLVVRMLDILLSTREGRSLSTWCQLVLFNLRQSVLLATDVL